MSLLRFVEYTEYNDIQNMSLIDLLFLKSTRWEYVSLSNIYYNIIILHKMC